jgi:hypothetical protein
MHILLYYFRSEETRFAPDHPHRFHVIQYVTEHFNKKFCIIYSKAVFLGAREPIFNFERPDPAERIVHGLSIWTNKYDVFCVVEVDDCGGEFQKYVVIVCVLL